MHEHWFFGADVRHLGITAAIFLLGTGCHRVRESAVKPTCDPYAIAVEIERTIGPQRCQADFDCSDIGLEALLPFLRRKEAERIRRATEVVSGSIRMIEPSITIAKTTSLETV